MRCSSCGARCDPTRSFCPACGSAVFLDDETFVASQRTLARAHPTVQAAGQRWQQSVSSPRSLQRTRGRPAGTAAAETRSAGAAAAAVGSLIRSVVVIGLAVYAFSALQRVPEVRRIATDLLRGEADLASARDALRSFLGEAGPGEADPAAAGGAPASRGAAPSAPVAATPPSARQIFEPGEAGVTAPLAIQRVPARYPEEALRRGLQGTVILRAIVEPDGTVSDVRVTRSIDATYGLDEEAAKAVRQWRFEPGKRNGDPVRSTAIVTVTFARRAATAPGGRR